MASYLSFMTIFGFVAIGSIIQVSQGVTTSYTTKSVVSGRDVDLPCRVDNYGSAYLVVWKDPSDAILFRGQTPVTSDGRFIIVHTREQIWDLRIQRAKELDQGNYTCQVYDTDQGGVVQIQSVGLQIQVPPKITYHSSDTSAPEGEIVTLTCQGIGPPSPTFTWTFSKGSSGIPKGVGDGPSPFLELVNITRADAGIYECIADNGVAPSASAKIRLDVEFVPVVSVPYQRVNQEVNRATSLECVITGNPRTENYWVTPKGLVIRTTIENQYTVTSWQIDGYQEKLELQIINITDKDFGSYMCVCGNMYGSGNATVELTEMIKDGAHITTIPQNSLKNLGEEVLFECSVKQMSTRDNLVWWFQPAGREAKVKVFESNPSYNSDTVGYVVPGSKYEVEGFYNLRVKMLELDDGGTYTCELTGKVKYSAKLAIAGDLKCASESITLLQGQMANLACSMHLTGPSSPWHSVWLHGTEAKGSITTDWEGLVIRKLTFRPWAADSGVYTCRVTNDEFAFDQQCQTNLIVIEATTMPPPPLPNHRNSTPTMYPPQLEENGFSLLWLVIVLSMLCLLLVLTLVGAIAFFQNRLSQVRRERDPPVQPFNGQSMIQPSTQAPVYRATTPTIHPPPPPTSSNIQYSKVPLSAPEEDFDTETNSSTPQETKKAEKMPLTKSTASLAREEPSLLELMPDWLSKRGGERGTSPTKSDGGDKHQESVVDVHL